MTTTRPQFSSRTKLLLFDPNRGGHHAPYIVYLLRAWQELNIPGNVVAAVSPRLFDDHTDLRTLPDQEGWDRISFLEMPEAVHLEGAALLQKGLRERQLLRQYVEYLRPEQVMCMYMDHTQFALASGLRFSYPVTVSGLFLRVSHHRLSSERLSIRQRVREWRKRLLLYASLRNRHAGVFFSADPSVADALRKLHPAATAKVLADPVPLHEQRDDAGEIRRRFGVEEHRQVLLLFGALAERKGVLQVVEALRRLSPEVCSELCFLLAGPVEADLVEHLPSALDELKRLRPVQIILEDRYLHEPEIAALMRAADVVLTPYLDHPGTSSVLIRAAGSGKPVICQDFGLMKEQVHAHHLGQLADAHDPSAIARCIVRFLNEPMTGFHVDSARAFAESQSPERFACELFASLNLLDGDHITPLPNHDPKYSVDQTI